MSAREYPDHPRLGVGIVTLRGDEVLLVQRLREPLQGFWTFPGGVVELGEDLRAAAHREMMEETGLDVEIGEIADVFERVERDPDGRVRYHYVVVDFVARVREGSNPHPHAADDAANAQWIACAQIGNYLITPGVERVLGRARQLLPRRRQAGEIPSAPE
jgi:ADP-ribose pyrophosphatase